MKDTYLELFLYPYNIVQFVINKKRIPMYFHGVYPFSFSTRSSSVKNGGHAIALCRNDSNITSYSSKPVDFKDAQEFCRSRTVSHRNLETCFGFMLRSYGYFIAKRIGIMDAKEP